MSVLSVQAFVPEEKLRHLLADPEDPAARLLTCLGITPERLNKT